MPWTRRVGSLSLSRCRCRCRCHCCFALPFPQQQGTGSVRDSETDRRQATATRRLLSVSASSSASAPASSERRVGQVVCFLYFANIKSIFLAGIICRLTQPQAQRQRQRQASHELNLLEPAQILTKQKSLAAARCMNYLGSCNLPFARAKCALPPLTPCQHYPPLQLALKLYSLTAVVFSSRSVRFCLLFRKLIIFEDEAASSPSQHLPAALHSVFFFPLSLPSQLAFTIYSTISLPP